MSLEKTRRESAPARLQELPGRKRTVGLGRACLPSGAVSNPLSAYRFLPGEEAVQEEIIRAWANELAVQRQKQEPSMVV